uniref:Uncharacterized protein n=1 Tax=Mastacembelus armatus TaxID=205130 RepID=A0A7N8X547_9TELE
KFKPPAKPPPVKMKISEIVFYFLATSNKCFLCTSFFFRFSVIRRHCPAIIFMLKLDLVSTGFTVATSVSAQSDAEVKMRTKHQEEAHFTLTLTPEAVLLLQRRNSERQRSAARNTGSGAGVSGSSSDSRRRRENSSKRQQPATQRHSRIPVKNSSDAELRDIRSIVKISLLNEQHKYDDVEYEAEEDYGVDERVILKCTEWLRGLENTPVTVGNMYALHRRQILSKKKKHP